VGEQLYARFRGRDADRGPASAPSTKKPTSSTASRYVDRPPAQGHGRHLLESSETQVRDPRAARLLTEVQAELAGVKCFFERCGFRGGIPLRGSRRRCGAPRSSTAGALVSEVTRRGAAGAGALGSLGLASWSARSGRSAGAAAELEGLAIASTSASRRTSFIAIATFVFSRRFAPELLGPLLAASVRRVGTP